MKHRPAAPATRRDREEGLGCKRSTFRTKFFQFRRRKPHSHQKPTRSQSWHKDHKLYLSHERSMSSAVSHWSSINYYRLHRPPLRDAQQTLHSAMIRRCSSAKGCTAMYCTQQSLDLSRPSLLRCVPLWGLACVLAKRNTRC